MPTLDLPTPGEKPWDEKLNTAIETINVEVDYHSDLMSGGTTGQAWVKASDLDGDIEWGDVGGGGSEVRSDTDATYSYMGTAPAGTAEGSSGWTVTRITLTSPPVVETGAGSWTGRVGIIYS